MKGKQKRRDSRLPTRETSPVRFARTSMNCIRPRCPLPSETIDIELGFAMKMPPWGGIHIVVSHRGGRTVGNNIEIGVAKVHQSYAKHHGISHAIARSQRHKHAADIHAAQFSSCEQFYRSGVVGEGLEGIPRIGGARIGLPSDGSAMAGKAVHRPDAVRHHILQRFGGIFDTRRESIPLEGHFPPLFGGRLLGPLFERGGPDLPHFGESRLVKVSGQIGFFGLESDKPFSAASLAKADLAAGFSAGSADCVPGNEADRNAKRAHKTNPKRRRCDMRLSEKNNGATIFKPRGRPIPNGCQASRPRSPTTIGQNEENWAWRKCRLVTF
jgi:hypothetical protein